MAAGSLSPQFLPSTYQLRALCFFLLVCLAPQRAEAVEASAESFFRRLPVDIFENTGGAFAEADKDLLFSKGYTSTWLLAYNDADTLIVSALDAVRTEVILHLFRGASGGVAVLSARTPDACACEFWRWDDTGGLVPQAPPREPSVADFFPPDQPPPADLQADIFICPTESYNELEAKPRFWNAEGPVNLAPALRVRWAWSGAEFVRAVSP